MLLMVLNLTIGNLLMTGIGIWGNNIPVGWAFDIINFVWWIGIGHAGTLISAILLLFRQQWRTSINRFAEAMTLFAVACAAMFPLLHTGRPWLAVYWLFPYPNTMGLWPQFRSPLIWDVFAVSTYGTVSALFWFTGLVPDMATLRDRAKSRVAQAHLRDAVARLARLGQALAALRDGVPAARRHLDAAGALGPLGRELRLRGVGAARLARDDLPALLRRRRDLLRLRDGDDAGDSAAEVLRPRRLHHDAPHPQHDQGHAGDRDDRGVRLRQRGVLRVVQRRTRTRAYMMYNRMTGPYAVFYWSLIAINAVMIQLFWFRSVRDNIPLLFVLSLFVNVGMWLERFIIIVTSLHRDFLPSSWDMYAPTRWDFGMFAGTIGLFLALFFLFIRFLPAIAIFEMRTIVPEAKLKAEHHG